MSQAKTKTRVYKNLEDLPEILEPGRYITRDAELEMHEPTSRRVAAKMLRLLRERRGHRFI